MAGVHGHPFVGDATHFDDLLEESERLGRHWTWDVGCLAGIVGDEANCVGKWAVLGFSSQVENWKAMGGMEEGMEAVRGQRKGDTGGDGR